MNAEKVTFGSHDQSEWKLLPYRAEAESPQAETHTVEVPGRDGALDFTEALDGTVHYKSRRLSMEFYCFGEDGELPQLEEDCRNALHGKKMQISLDADPEYYYLGRLSVSWSSGENVDTVSIEAECDPYKYKKQETEAEFDVAGTLEITLSNGWMPVSPEIETDAEMQLLFGNASVSLNPGTQKAPGLLLKKGENSLTLKGNGHVKFKYREGAL